MKEQIVMKAAARASLGTSAVGRLRRTGWLPAVVYTPGRAADRIQVNEHDFGRLLHRHRSEQIVMDLVVDAAAPKKVLLKEVQHHPVTGRLLHADFYEISMTRKLRVDVPIKLVGEPVGVSQQGGILDHILRAVEIECLPGDLIEEIAVDVSQLALGKHLTVADIKLDPAKYAIVTGADIAIAAVSMPKAEEEEVPAEAAEAGAEPEVITAKKEEGEEEGAEGAKKDEKGGAKEKDGAKAAGKEAKAAAGKEAKPAAGKDAKPAAGKEGGKAPAGKEKAAAK
jgi:large subunit ribosomal protein L25